MPEPTLDELRQSALSLLDERDENGQPTISEGELEAISLAYTDAPPPRVFCPQIPTPKQQQFLNLSCIEGFFGGAAGGAKSSALLIAALQYVHVPGYAAIIFRKSYPLLSQPGGLLFRAKEWLIAQGVQYSGERKTFTFPSGATLSFGHLESTDSHFNYAGSEYQFIGFDELTEFPETQYTFLFSRLRRVSTIDVPLRVRSASNPGGTGHGWVRERFVSDEAMDDILARSTDAAANLSTYYVGDRAFVPSMLRDNPHINYAEYMRSLDRLDPVTRARLVAGDWRVSEAGVFKQDWLRYFCFQGANSYGLFAPGNNSQPVSGVVVGECTRFLTVDCAASSDDVKIERRTGRRSRSVVSSWDYHAPSGNLFWRDQAAGYWGFTELVAQVTQMIVAERPSWTGIEGEKTGKALLSVLSNRNVRELSHQGKDKLARASDMLNIAARGKFWIPADALWRRETETELLTWTGHPDETADRIDTAAYAGIHCGHNRVGPIRLHGPLITSSGLLAGQSQI